MSSTISRRLEDDDFYQCLDQIAVTQSIDIIRTSPNSPELHVTLGGPSQVDEIEQQNIMLKKRIDDVLSGKSSKRRKLEIIEIMDSENTPEYIPSLSPSQNAVLKEIPFFTETIHKNEDLTVLITQNYKLRPSDIDGFESVYTSYDSTYNFIAPRLQINRHAFVIKEIPYSKFKPHRYIIDLVHEVKMHEVAQMIDETLSVKIFDAIVFNRKGACVVYEKPGPTLRQYAHPLPHAEVIRKFYTLFDEHMFHFDLSPETIVMRNDVPVISSWGKVLKKTGPESYHGVDTKNIKASLRRLHTTKAPNEHTAFIEQQLLALIDNGYGFDYFIEQLCLYTFARNYIQSLFDGNHIKDEDQLADILHMCLDVTHDEVFQDRLINAYQLVLEVKETEPAEYTRLLECVFYSQQSNVPVVQETPLRLYDCL